MCRSKRDVLCKAGPSHRAASIAAVTHLDTVAWGAAADPVLLAVEQLALSFGGQQLLSDALPVVAMPEAEPQAGLRQLRAGWFT